MKQMNQILYSVFMMQLLLVMLFASLSMIWTANNSKDHNYLGEQDTSTSFDTLIIRMLSFWVAYSHFIPISLYVVLEIIKIGQSILLQNDPQIKREGEKITRARTSDLIEELGQVKQIFADKTGTLTKNEMKFEMCATNGKIFTSPGEMKALLVKYKYQDDEERATGNAIHSLIKHMSMCHTVFVNKDSEEGGKWEQAYEAASPDELGLVLGASSLGCTFKERTRDNIKIHISYTKSDEEYEILHEFPFTSDRQRQSMLTKRVGSDTIVLMMKGADDTMIKRLQKKS
jgi:magnesium-transporting ATPase (P-type)